MLDADIAACAEVTDEKITGGPCKKGDELVNQADALFLGLDDRSKGDHEKAISLYKQAIDLYKARENEGSCPNITIAYYNLALVSRQLSSVG